MYSLSINQLLEVFEHHLALQGSVAGDALLHFSSQGISIGSPLAGHTYRDLWSPNRLNTPLSALEKKRLESLDRKAMGGLLTEQEDAEFEALLEIKRHYSTKELAIDASQVSFQKRA